MIREKELITLAKGNLIRYRGDFDLDRLYKECKKWFKSKNYIFTEKEHTDKTRPQGDELNIKFMARREIDDYAEFNIETYFFILEVNKKDNKISNAHVKINIEAFVKLDYKGLWQKSPFKKFLFFIYNNYIIKKKILNEYEGKLENELTEYSNLIKSYLNLE